MVEGIVGIPQMQGEKTEMIVGTGVAGIVFQKNLELSTSRAGLAEFGLEDCEAEACRGVVGIEFEYFTQMFGSLFACTFPEKNEGKLVPGIGKSRVQLDGLEEVFLG